MDRLQQKNQLFIQLGMLFGPLQHLADHPEQYDEQERAETIARYSAEYHKLSNKFSEFSVGQPGHNFKIEDSKFSSALYMVQSNIADGDKELSDIVTQRLQEAHDALNAIPIPRSSTILESGTPFSTYCVLKDLCESNASQEIVWIDAYMDSNIFHRFLRGLQPTTSVVLVTSEPRASAASHNKQRWNEFLDISRLYATERGPSNYRLIVHQESLHDRWLMLDYKRLYQLGGSAKDAADKKYFTIARMDASAANLQAINDHIINGHEYFGPNTQSHK